MSLKQPPKTVVINGQELPVIPAEAVETIKNKRTGKVYDSKAHFDSDVADPNTDTVMQLIIQNYN
jgi:hypothetical protein